MEFIKNILSSCLGAFIAMLLLVVLGIAILSGLASKEEIVISDQSVLHLKLDGEITEMHEDDPLQELIPVAEANRSGLVQLIQAINHAKEDSKISAIFLEVGYIQTSFATLRSLREALLAYKESGKKVIAYNENYTESAYYLSSVADLVYLNPLGELEFNGLVAQFASFKKLLDKLEIKPQVFRVGEYKSAVEPFLKEKMSSENREQLQALLNSIYETIMKEVADSRGISPEKLKTLSDRMLVRKGRDALEEKLIDGLLYKDELEAKLLEEVGMEADSKLKLVKQSRYLKTVSTYVRSDNEVAVVVAQGSIMPGTSNLGDDIIGADSYVQTLRKLRKNKDVKAVVLRVNSPGGEYLSADMIWREVLLLAQEKPVIASMGDYAASGGYYISAACDYIIAQPMTVTGSIGIFGLLFDMSGFFENWIGVTFDEVRTGHYGDRYTVTRPLTAEEKEIIQLSLDSAYGNFLRKVSDGRKMTLDKVKSLAAGRIWTGTQGVENGLVDEIGGLEEAIQKAVADAGIGEDFKVRYYPEQKSFLETYFKDAQEESLQSTMGPYYLIHKKWQEVKQYQGIQARMPFELTIK